MSDEKLIPIADQEGAALEQAHAVERSIQLEGRQNPDTFKMPDGSTLTETRKKNYEAEVKEGDAASKANTERARELSIASDPLYAEGATAVMNGTNATIIPAKNEEPQITGGDLKTGTAEIEGSAEVHTRADTPTLQENVNG